jgi:hypothetical protein
MPRKSESITTDLYSSLMERCRAAGISLSEACREAGVGRSAVDRWKRQTPRPIENLFKLEAAIQKAAERKS